MKIKLPFSFLMSLTILGVSLLPVVAQSRSSLSDADIERLASDYLPLNHQIISQSSTKKSVSFEVCGESKNWVRPTLKQQLKHLKILPEFTPDSETNVKSNLLKGHLELVWKNPIISFDNYGLALLREVWHYSGMWTLPKSTIARCLQDDKVLKVRDGKIAWIFLLQYKVQNVKWQNSHYVLEVEPTQTGLQVIQFNRRDGQSLLPLKVIDKNGRNLNFSNRGWENMITVWH